MAAVILASGSPGHRMMLPNGRVMIHQPTLGVCLDLLKEYSLWHFRECILKVNRATAIDVMIKAREGENTKRRLIEILAKHTERSREHVSEVIPYYLYFIFLRNRIFIHDIIH